MNEAKLTTVYSGNTMTSRNSNLELYRIIVMILIVAHHYVVNSGLLQVLKDAPFNATSAVMLIFGAWGKTGINCFIMITGWFMCKSSFTVRKFFKLYIQITFYAVILYLIFCLTDHASFHPLVFAGTLFHFKEISSNFPTCFLIFYLLIPFINVLIQNTNKRQLSILLIILLSVYTVIPSCPTFNTNFNYVSWFSVVYLVAAYLRYYGVGFKITHKQWGIVTVFLIILGSLSIVALSYLLHHRNIDMDVAYAPHYFVLDSNRLLPLLLAVSSFMFFKDIKIPHSRLINVVGATSFGVLLIHANSDTMRRWLWQETVDCIGNFGDSLVYTMGYAIAMVLVIFFVCSGIDWFRMKFIEPHYMRIVDKILKKFKTL